MPLPGSSFRLWEQHNFFKVVKKFRHQPNQTLMDFPFLYHLLSFPVPLRPSEGGFAGEYCPQSSLQSAVEDPGISHCFSSLFSPCCFSFCCLRPMCFGWNICFKMIDSIDLRVRMGVLEQLSSKRYLTFFLSGVWEVGSQEPS